MKEEEKYKKIEYNKIPVILGDYPVVQDAFRAVECLRTNKVPIARYEYGNSMMPILRSGQFCVIKPLEHDEEANIGDAVFCYVNGYLGTHMVLMKSKIDPEKTWYLIGMTNTQPIGWTKNIFGIANALNVIVEEHPVVTEEETNCEKASE